MVVVKAGNIKKDGVVVGEDVVILTDISDKYRNGKVTVIDTIALPVRIRNEYKRGSIDETVLQHFLFYIDGLLPIETQGGLMDWQQQNTIVKQKLIEFGVPEDAITICEDLDENGNPVNIVD